MKYTIINNLAVVVFVLTIFLIQPTNSFAISMFVITAYFSGNLSGFIEGLYK